MLKFAPKFIQNLLKNITLTGRINQFESLVSEQHSLGVVQGLINFSHKDVKGGSKIWKK